MNFKRGISMIVLVITVLVMIILAGVVIIMMTDNNPIKTAEYAKLRTSVADVREAVMQYSSTVLMQNGDVDLSHLMVDSTRPDLVIEGVKYHKLMGDTALDNAKIVLGCTVEPPVENSYYAITKEGACICVVDAKGAKKMGYELGNVATINVDGVYLPAK